MTSSSARRHLFDGALRLFVAEALLPLSGLVTSAVLTRRLGVAAYGRFALAATLVGTIQWVLTALLARATIRIVSESRDWQPGASAALRLYLFGGFAAGLALAHVNVLLGRGRFRERARARASRWTARLAPIVAFVEAGLSVTGAILGSLGASLAELIVARRLVQPSLGAGKTPPLGRLWSYAVPLVAVAGYAFVVPRAGIEGAAWVTATVAVSGCLASLVAVGRILGARPELATLARVAAVCASGWIASSVIPGAGVWILPKLAVLFLGCAATLLALGELPRSERHGLWAALRSAA